MVLIHIALAGIMYVYGASKGKNYGIHTYSN
jgi:hypothetical protein